MTPHRGQPRPRPHHHPPVPPPHVADLVAAARGGDAAAFAQLYAAHVGPTRAYARRLVAGHAADDLVAEAFTRTWAQLVDGGGPRDAFAAYVRAVVLNLHLRSMRRDQPHQWVADVEDAVLANPERAAALVEANPEQVLLDELLNRRLMEALDSLPERWQTALVMVYIEARPYTEVAARLHLSVPAARQLARRARVRMRAALRDLHAEDRARYSSEEPGHWT